MSPPDLQSRYHIHVFWSDEDRCWIADALDLRFCSAHGQTPAEAVAELEIALAGWLKTARERGISIPEPRYRPPRAG
jgi:predicted RNase H-like HicB family nuclease